MKPNIHRFLAAIFFAGSAVFQSAAVVFALEAAPTAPDMMLGPQLGTSTTADSPQASRSHGVDRSIGDLSDLASTSNSLIDHGGPVLPSPNIYVFYWGNPSDFPADFSDGL